MQRRILVAVLALAAPACSGREHRVVDDGGGEGEGEGAAEGEGEGAALREELEAARASCP